MKINQVSENIERLVRELELDINKSLSVFSDKLESLVKDNKVSTINWMCVRCSNINFSVITKHENMLTCDSCKGTTPVPNIDIKGED